jgi:hypothetical protein
MNEDNIKRVLAMPFANVYPMYIQKAEKKGRTKAEVDEVICWLTGYSQKQLDSHIEKQTSFADFIEKAPKLNPSRSQVTGVICGIRLEELPESTFKEMRYIDKLVDELAKGKPMEKVLRKA